jgi:predicted ester cyclase
LDQRLPFADGKIVEAWEEWDEYGMRRQLSGD